MNQNSLASDYINKGLQSHHLPEADRDEILLHKVAGQDEEAFGELYHRFALSLYNFLARMCGDTAVAEDILQEVFVAVWKGASRFRGEAKVKTWLFNIAYKQAATWLRRRGNRPDVGALSVDDLPLGEDIEKQTHKRWRDQRVRQAVEKLSPDHRVVVVLAFYYNLSYTEIAQVMGCPVGTVKSRMSYARQQLGQLLADVNKPEYED